MKSEINHAVREMAKSVSGGHAAVAAVLGYTKPALENRLYEVKGQRIGIDEAMLIQRISGRTDFAEAVASESGGVFVALPEEANCAALAKEDPPAPLSEIRPQHIREYLDWRSKTAKVRANREVALFSHIFNKAREWGYTDNANPCMGVKKFKETGRDVYVSDDLFWRVFRCADYHIRQLMLVAYLCSQRVSDTLNLKVSDFREGALWVRQAKSGQRLRVALVGEFAEVVEQIMAEREDAKHDFLFSRNGRRISYNQLRYGLDKARRLAGVEKDEFQFRDLRAKAGTDKDEEAGLSAAKDLLGHKNSSMTVHYVRHRKGKLVNPTRMGKFRDYVEQDGKCRTNEQACGNEKTT